MNEIITNNFSDILKKIYSENKSELLNPNNIIHCNDKIKQQFTAIINGILKKSLDEFLTSDSLKELSTTHFNSSLEEKCDFLIKNTILKSCASGAAAAAGFNTLIPLFLSGAGTPAAISADISLQLAETAYLLNLQFNLILQIAYICGIKFNPNNNEDIIKLCAIGYGVKVNGTLKNIILKDVLPQLISKLINKEIIALPPFVNIITIPIYNSLTTYYIGSIAKSTFIKENFCQINLNDIADCLKSWGQKDISISFSDYNK